MTSPRILPLLNEYLNEEPETLERFGHASRFVEGFVERLREEGLVFSGDVQEELALALLDLSRAAIHLRRVEQKRVALLGRY